MELWLIVVIVVVVLFLGFVIGVYNRMIQARNKVRNQFAQIDVQLQQRFDMIPDLVEMVKGYAKHESATFEQVTQARNAYGSAAGNATASLEANDMLTNALGKLFAVAEAYPDLKANENFLRLQASEEKMEDQIRYSRQFYNDEVTKFNDLIQTFPNNMFAGLFGFKAEVLLAVADAERKNPEIKF